MYNIGQFLSKVVLFFKKFKSLVIIFEHSGVQIKLGLNFFVLSKYLFNISAFSNGVGLASN